MIAEFGTDEQRQTWLPGLAAGTTKMVFAITEPDAGSNTHRLSTNATRDGDGLAAAAGPSTTSPGWTKPRRCWSWPGPAPTRAATPSCPCSGARPDAPGLDASVLPVDLMLPEKQFTLHFDDVRLGPEALVGGEARASGRSSTG